MTSPKPTKHPRGDCRKRDDSAPSDGAGNPRRNFDRFEKEYFSLIPSMPVDEFDSHDGEDVTVDHLERVQRLADDINSAWGELDILGKEVEFLFRFTEKDRPADGLISLHDACAEIAPELSAGECCSRLRSAGILSNDLGHWNQAFGGPLKSGWLRNQFRVFRVTDGSHRG
ncbi:MAG: hypothetical protein KC931_19735, partial [Candidatus Omnitrophica bacterium]|nr:hypothetical protein [Candidatus Omnitrophota bacterium]